MNQVAQGRHALLVFGPSRACKEPIHLPGIEFLDVTFDGADSDRPTRPTCKKTQVKPHDFTFRWKRNLGQE